MTTKKPKLTISPGSPSRAFLLEAGSIIQASLQFRSRFIELVLTPVRAFPFAAVIATITPTCTWKQEYFEVYSPKREEVLRRFNRFGLLRTISGTRRLFSLCVLCSMIGARFNPRVWGTSAFVDRDVGSRPCSSRGDRKLANAWLRDGRGDAGEYVLLTLCDIERR